MEFDSVQTRLKAYIPTLDGLRAIAILWVIVHNAGIEKLLHNDLAITKVVVLFTNIGWLGVQLFFVLSGFLITGILLDGKAHKRQGLFKRFYIRRFLRIFPIYYCFLFGVMLVGLLSSVIPGWAEAAYRHMGWYLVYLNNWVQPFQDIGFGHFWSLAVEEQFYLLWPMVIVLIPFGRLYWVCAALVIMSPLFRFWVMGLGLDSEVVSDMAYVLTPARLDALTIGAMLAIALRDPGRCRWVQDNALKVLLLFGGYMLMVLGLLRDYASTGNGIAFLNQTMAAVVFAAMLYYALGLHPENRLNGAYRRFLCLPWMRAIGKYSYAIYIFHKPVATALHESYGADFHQRLAGWSGVTKLSVFLGDAALVFVISFALAWMSWRLIEQPFLNLKRKVPM